MPLIKSILIQFLAVAIIAGGFSLSARAQIGTGWTEIHPNKSVQHRGNGAYRIANGIETFSLTNANVGTDNRAEQRIWDDYTNGTHQFEGYVKVVSLDGTLINLKQTFQSQAAWFLFTVDHNGTVRDHQNKTVLATNVIGRTIRLNTIHDMDSGNLYVYVDGVLKEIRPGGHAPFMDKYGAYRATSGVGPVTVEWSHVRLWTGGTIDKEPVEPVATAPVPSKPPELIMDSPVVSTAPAPAPDTVATPVPTATAPQAPVPQGYIPDDVEKQFLAQIVSAVTNNDTSWIADHMRYPVSIVANDEISIISSKEAFKKVLARHLTGDIQAKIVQGVQDPLVRNWQGIGVGDGMLWFSEYQPAGQTGLECGIFAIGGFAFQPHNVPKTAP